MNNKEILHGKKLAQTEPEKIWGWKTPAGKFRAVRRAELIASGAGLGPGIHALEIGCGTGIFTKMFAQTGARLTAVDISPDLLKIARTKRLLEDRVQFLEKPFEACEVNRPFDAVIGSSILHHLNIEPALKRIYSLLKSGGMMSFAEPNMLNPQIMVQKNIPVIKAYLGDSPDETAFIRWSFNDLLCKIGFKNIKIQPFDWIHPNTPRRMIPLVRYAGGILEKTPILREFAGSLYIQCQRR
jgi:2-polyprenyl-3-methyl-5-hydroxy-6-metoxy-1,4-benzoquinol methylase